MKIYNEVITQFNDLTGQWETMYEDSFEYNGSNIVLAQGLPPNATPISGEDTIADTIKITSGYFTNGDGTLTGEQVYTGSLADSNEKYYFNALQNHPDSSSAAVQFSVTYGHILGKGSDTYGDSSTNDINLKGEAQSIYRQFTSLLLHENEQSGGFKIAQHGSAGAIITADANNGRDDYFYALIGKRDKFKDRINKKAWTLLLSGSKSGLTSPEDGFVGSSILHLTDDSKYVGSVATPGGPRYNIVSGTLGVPTGSDKAVAFAHKTYGHFYPEMGCMIFSGAQLSASIPGINSVANTNVTVAGFTASFDHKHTDVGYLSSSGFAPNLTQQINAKNALRFINCMSNIGSMNTFRLRSEEDQTQENYFCRIRAQDYNFSSNPTFTTGSFNKVRHVSMRGNPQVFITGIGLYNSTGHLLAVAKLSSPLKKNFASEATVKVKLTY
jgi:hypothetical protein